MLGERRHINDFASVELERLSRRARFELKRQYTHADEIGSVDALEALGNHRLDTASSGKAVSSEDMDLCARIFSMGKLHHAMTGTGAVAIAVAAAIPGTLVSRVLGGGRHDEIRFGHPSGTLRVGAHASEQDGTWAVTKALMSRSARRLMEGQVFVPTNWHREK